jgi:O-antigen/teichoic acid export membrane protein
VIKRQIIFDGMWVATAQLTSAIGALVTVRVLTEVLTPEKFGILTLALGIVTFGQALLCTPILQALLRYYPEMHTREDVETLCLTAKRMILRRGSYPVAIGAMVSAPAYLFWDMPIVTVILAVSCMLIEMRRSYSVTLFNPTRRQKPFAAVMTLDAVLRPTLAWLLARVTTFEVEAVLTAFIATSLIGVVVSSIWGLDEDTGKESRVQSQVIETRIQTFSLPLLPLAAVGWMNGTLDRYVIAGMLGAAQAGLYAAAYGLVSRPFLMVSHILEQTLRPVYYELSSRDDELTNKYFYLWLNLALVGGVLGWVFIFLFAHPIADVLLGTQFSEAASVMPWIAAAYATLMVVQVLEKRLYIASQTRRVLIVEVVGVAAVILTLPLLLSRFGVEGGSIALFIGSAVQIGALLLFLAFIARVDVDVNRKRKLRDTGPDLSSLESA